MGPALPFPHGLFFKLPTNELTPRFLQNVETSKRVQIQTKFLKDCMEEHADYYGVMLQAEEESKKEKEAAAAAAAAAAEAGEASTDAPSGDK